MDENRDLETEGGGLGRRRRRRGVSLFYPLLGEGELYDHETGEKIALTPSLLRNPVCSLFLQEESIGGKGRRGRE